MDDKNAGLLTSRSTRYSTGLRVLGSVATVGRAAVFGQVMGLVATTVACTALGGYIGRNLPRGAAIACLIGGVVCIVATMPAARRSERLGITTLFAAGLLLGLGLAPGLSRYTQAEAQVVWQAAAATASSLWSGMSAGDAVDGPAGFSCCALMTGANTRPARTVAMAAQSPIVDFILPVSF